MTSPGARIAENRLGLFDAGSPWRPCIDILWNGMPWSRFNRKSQIWYVRTTWDRTTRSLKLGAEPPKISIIVSRSQASSPVDLLAAPTSVVVVAPVLHPTANGLTATVSFGCRQAMTGPQSSAHIIMCMSTRLTKWRDPCGCRML